MRILSIALGLVLAVWLGYGLHTNPRWTWAPGEGELPRDVVSMYMDKAYAQGKPDEATALFLSPKTKDEVPRSQILPDGKAFKPHVRRVIAEGFNVAVQYGADTTPGTEYLEIFNVKGGRILSRERITYQASQTEASINTATPHTANQVRSQH